MRLYSPADLPLTNKGSNPNPTSSLSSAALSTVAHTTSRLRPPALNHPSRPSASQTPTGHTHMFHIAPAVQYLPRAAAVALTLPAYRGPSSSQPMACILRRDPLRLTHPAPHPVLAHNNNRLHPPVRGSAGKEVCKLQQHGSTTTITCQCAAGERSEWVNIKCDIEHMHKQHARRANVSQ